MLSVGVSTLDWLIDQEIDLCDLTISSRRFLKDIKIYSIERPKHQINAFEEKKKQKQCMFKFTPKTVLYVIKRCD